MKTLRRRTFLRGVAAGSGIAVGLPLLEAMLDTHGTALADGSSLPLCFGVFHWGNGVKPKLWHPQQTGNGWELTPELEPFGPVREDISIVTGYDSLPGKGHVAGKASMLSGAGIKQLPKTGSFPNTTFSRPSIDQVVAKAWEGNGTAFRSLEVGMYVPGTSEGTTAKYLSHNGPESFNPHETDPAALFDRIFSGLSDGADSGAGKIALARASILDAVAEDAQRLAMRVGAKDKLRLEQHLDSIRAIEKRLSNFQAQCAVPEAPISYTGDLNRANFAARNELFAQLLAVALACDLTRVFSYMFSTWLGATYNELGQNDELHGLTHNEAGGDEGSNQPQVHEAVTFTMQQLANFIGVLGSFEEADKFLIDRVALLAVTDVREGGCHSGHDMPVVLAGRAGGLRTGIHHRGSGAVTRIHLTVLQALGLPVTSFGEGEGETSDAIGELLA